MFYKNTFDNPVLQIENVSSMLVLMLLLYLVLRREIPHRLFVEHYYLTA